MIRDVGPACLSQAARRKFGRMLKAARRLRLSVKATLVAWRSRRAAKQERTAAGSQHLITRRAFLFGALSALGMHQADAGMKVWLRAMPPSVVSYVVPSLQPSANWDGTRAGMLALTPALSVSYQEMAGYSGPNFAEEPIAAFDEYPGIFIEDTGHFVGVGAVNADPRRGGVAKVIYRLGDASQEVTQQIYSSRKTCVFPIKISSAAPGVNNPNGGDGDAILIADVYPVRGYPTRITLPITLATNGNFTRQIVYVNPDPINSYSGSHADTGQPITIGAGSDLNPGTQSQPFLTLQMASVSGAGNSNGGAVDILAVPNTPMFCDNPQSTAALSYAGYAINNNTRMLRIRPAFTTGLIQIGRNDKAAFYSTPASPYTYAAPSPAYGGVGTGVPLFNTDGHQYEPYKFKGSTNGGDIWFTSKMIEFNRGYFDLSSFSLLKQHQVAATGGSYNLNGDWTWGTGFYAFTGCQLVDPNGSAGPVNGYQNSGNDNVEIQISFTGARSICESNYVGSGISGISFIRNMTSTTSYDSLSENITESMTRWNHVGLQDQDCVNKQSMGYASIVNNVLYREDGWVETPSFIVTISGGTTATFTDAQGNAVAHGLAAGGTLKIKSAGGMYPHATVDSIASSSVLTLSSSYANGSYGYATGTLLKSAIQAAIATDGVTMTIPDYDGITSFHKLQVGDIFSIELAGTTFKTTIASVLNSTTMVLADAYTAGAGKSTYYNVGYTIVGIQQPSSQVGGYSHLYYSGTSRLPSVPVGNTSYQFVQDLVLASGLQMRPLTGALAGSVVPLSTAGTWDNTVTTQVGVFPPTWVVNVGGTPTTYALPTISTSGTTLTLSGAPPTPLINYYYNTACTLFPGQQIVNDATDQARFVVSVVPGTNGLQAILNAPFTDGSGNSVNLPAGTVYRTGCYVLVEGNFVGVLNIGDSFWTGAIAHPDYFQLASIGSLNGVPAQFQSVAKNWWMSNYSMRVKSEQIAIPQINIFTGLGTLTTDGAGNGIIAAPLSTSLAVPLTMTTTTGGGVTTCKMYNASGSLATPTVANSAGTSSGVVAGQKIAILNSDGSVFQIVTVAFQGTNTTGFTTTFTTTSPLPSDIAGAAFLIGHTLVQGDSIALGPYQSYPVVGVGVSRRCTGTSWDADFTQHITFNQDFTSSVYPSGVSTAQPYRQNKVLRNAAFVNSTFFQYSPTISGAGLSGALPHWVWVQTTEAAPLSNTGYGLSEAFPQNLGWFDSILQNLNNDKYFAAVNAGDMIRDNCNFINSDAGGSMALTDAVVPFTWDSSTGRPTSKNHIRMKGQLDAAGLPTGKALVPYDAEGNLLVPGTSYVGGLQPLAA